MKYLLFLSISLSVLILSAQNFNAGILAGINASQVSGDTYGGFNKAGLLIGVYSDIDVKNNLNLQFEINYSQKGSRKNPKSDETDTDFFLLRMNYIEVPVMLRWKKKNFTYEAGLYLGQLVGDHLEDENGVFELDPNLNQFSQTDFGGLIGLNYNFTEHLIMNWRLNNSITTIREYDSGGSFIFDNGMFHHYFSFSFRYEFIGANG